jgi:hypothetical protein
MRCSWNRDLLRTLRSSLLCGFAMQECYMSACLQPVLAIDNHLLVRDEAAIDQSLPPAYL